MEDLLPVVPPHLLVGLALGVLVWRQVDTMIAGSVGAMVLMTFLHGLAWWWPILAALSGHALSVIGWEFRPVRRSVDL